MRVLAVDYDRACLRMLEQMLLKCRYNVTATTQSRKAIEMLRENKVISDVHMPGIDGFQLLELVGLEMDLPGIQGVASENCANHDKRLDKKRKEQSEDADDNEQENENASPHKKPGLVWVKSCVASSKLQYITLALIRLFLENFLN
ncbi:hypothetical protein S83_022641 [Arachis hypogaea]